MAKKVEKKPLTKVKSSPVKKTTKVVRKPAAKEVRSGAKVEVKKKSLKQKRILTAEGWRRKMFQLKGK